MTGEYALWLTQVRAILRLELKKNFLSRRGWWIWIIASMMPLLTLAHSLSGNRRCTIGEDTIIFAGIFQIFYLRFGIFFGCVGVFMNLFRGEVLERSLHYYFLAPVRREVLVLGKYVSGLITALVCFGGSVTLAWLFIYRHFGWESFRQFAFVGPGIGHYGWYALVTLLAVIGYGAVFTLMGLKFGNPMIPAGIVLIWEGINGFLPSALQKISVLYYLKQLCPVEVPVRGPLAIMTVAADPVPGWLAIAGVLALAVLVMAMAAVEIRRMEISYSAE
jgi:hypothetical protein